MRSKISPAVLQRNSSNSGPASKAGHNNQLNGKKIHKIGGNKTLLNGLNLRLEQALGRCVRDIRIQQTLRLTAKSPVIKNPSVLLSGAVEIIEKPNS